MSRLSSHNRFPARLTSLCRVSVLLPFPGARAMGHEISGRSIYGGPDESLEVVLPFELQASFFHSLPIAGLMVTPDQIAQRVLLNPRLRVTTGLPISGKGIAIPIDESDVVDTHADPME